MSQEKRKGIEYLVLAITLLGVLFGLFGTFSVMQDKVSSMEVRINKIEEVGIDRDDSIRGSIESIKTKAAVSNTILSGLAESMKELSNSTRSLSTLMTRIETKLEVTEYKGNR